MVMILGTDWSLFQIAFNSAVIIISSIIAFFVAKWARNRNRKSRIATTLANLDPKTGLAKMRDIPDYNERPAAIRWEDEKGRINRRNTKGHPTFQMDFSAAQGGGIERIYACASNSRTCQSTEALCGEPNDDELANIADKSISLWDEQNSEMEIESPKFRQIWWQIVLGVLAGCGIGAVLLAVWLSRQPPPPVTNSTATHAPIMDAVNMVRIALAK